MIFEGYQEFINAFTFRSEGALTIPKRIREKALTMQIDLEIISTAQAGYRNFKSSPPYGFYGYAVIVFRNFAQIQIPISQPRQVLYYDRLESAYANWYNLYLANVAAQNFSLQQEQILLPIGNAVGVEFEQFPTECIAPPTFVELPIREIYLRAEFGTTFRIEISHWEAKTAQYGDCFYDAESGQIDDPEKDNGLPESGVQPQIAEDSNNPYAGFPEPSTQQELGDFFNSKLDNLDNPNSENASTRPNIPATSTTEGYYLEYIWESLQDGAQGTRLTGIARVPSLNNSNLSVTFVRENFLANAAFPDVRFDEIRIKIDGITVLTPITPRGYTVVGEIKFGKLPASTAEIASDYY